MKKGSKNTGITKACPSKDCRKTFLKNAEVKGHSKHLTKCPHCGIPAEVEMGLKPFVLIKVAVLLLVLVGTYQAITLKSLSNAFTAMINEYDIEIKN